MANIEPLPIEVTIPKIPPELPEKGKSTWTVIKPQTTVTKPQTWVHEPIPVEIQFPVGPRRTINLRIRIHVPGVGAFEVPVALTAVQPAEASS